MALLVKIFLFSRQLQYFKCGMKTGGSLQEITGNAVCCTVIPRGCLWDTCRREVQWDLGAFLPEQRDLCSGLHPSDRVTVLIPPVGE